MLIIGLTGGIASGKSAASHYFHSLGAALLSADVLAREVVTIGSDGLKALTDAFGDVMLLANGELDRKALRNRILESDDARHTVNALLHPRIRALSELRIDDAKNDGYDYLIYEVPLLIETQQADRFDRVVVVDVPLQLQIDRLLARDNTDGGNTNIGQVHAMLNAQASRDERLAAADDVIDNSGTIEQLHEQVESLHQRYLSLSRLKP
ncbi:MAG: dephospho-CoA kinase [Granulosicoccaceae bacterium]